MKNSSRILNRIMGISVGVFIFCAIYGVWKFIINPEFNEVYSVPWYFGIKLHGIFTFYVLAICIGLKIYYKRNSKETDIQLV